MAVMILDGQLGGVAAVVRVFPTVLCGNMSEERSSFTLVACGSQVRDEVRRKQVGRIIDCGSCSAAGDKRIRALAEKSVASSSCTGTRESSAF